MKLFKNFVSKLPIKSLLYLFCCVIAGYGLSEAKIAEVRQTVKPLKFASNITDEELMSAGQLGGQLYPTHKSIKSDVSSKENFDFGKAIQQWNRHEYRKAVRSFRKHIRKFPESPWVSEARLHIGCDARYNGNFKEAENQFSWIIAYNKEKKNEGAIRLSNKARMRLGVLKALQNDSQGAAKQFRKLKKESLSWRERTYASYWLHKISKEKIRKRESAKCGQAAIAYILKKLGKFREANKILKLRSKSEKGQSITEMMQLTESYSLAYNGVQIKLDDLRNISLPAIVQIDHSPKAGHYWVLEKILEKDLVFYDPLSRRTFKHNPETFRELWNGIAIVSSKNERIIKEKKIDKRTADTIFGGCCGVPRPEGDLGDPGENAGGRRKDECPQGAPIWKVNMTNMNIFMNDIPLWYQSHLGPSVEIKLSYNSLSSIAHYEPFGNKWQFNYGSYLVVDTSGVVTIFMPDGRRDIYSPDGQGGYSAPLGIFSLLTKLAENHFELKLLDGTIYEYNIPEGTTSLQPFLVKILNNHGHGITFEYDSNIQMTTIIDALGRETTLTYSGQGLVTRVEDPFGRFATFNYDGDHNLIKITDMGGIWTELAYDNDIYISKLKNARGEWSFLVRPADGISDDYYGLLPGSSMWEDYIITITDPLGGKEEFIYHGDYGDESHYISPNYYIDYLDFGQNNNFNENKITYPFSGMEAKLAGVRLPTGEEIYKEYDENTGKVSYISDNLGNTHSFEYNANGLVTKYIDAKYAETLITYYDNEIDIATIDNGLGPITFTYNDNHDILTITDRENIVTRFVYNIVGKLSQVIEGEGTSSQRTTEYVYDPASHEVIEIKVNGLTTATMTYDIVGRIASFTDTNNVTLTYEYNDLNQVIRINFTDGKSIIRELSSCCPGLVDRIIDRSGRAIDYTYDALKRLTEIQGPDGLLKYFYDANGNVIKILDPQQNETTYEYDSVDRLIKQIFANGDEISYAYEDGLLKKKTNARGTEISYTYDANYNIEGISYSDSTPPVSFSYDTYNRLVSRSDGIGTYSFGYDSNSILTSSDGPWEDDAVIYSYNNLLQRTSIQIGVATPTNYSSDALNRLLTIQNGDELFTYTYSGSSSAPSQLTLPNGSFTQFTYNGPLQRLTEISNKKADQSIISANEFTYTSNDQVDTETITNGLPITALQEETLEYNYNAVNQIVSATNPSRTFQYDADGNLIQSYTPQGNILTLNYDAESRLTSSEYTDNTQITHRTEYSYSGNNLLAETRKLENGSHVSSVRFIRDGLLAVQDRNGNNEILNEYTWGVSMGGGIGGLIQLKRSPNSYNYIYDGRGNVKALLDQNQTVVAAYNYSPFGELLSQTGTLIQPFQFSTKRNEADKGLSYYGYRYYLPSLSRWATRDPLGYAAGDFNIYRFVQNNPVNFIDPAGEFGIPGAVMGIVLGASAGFTSGITSGSPSSGVWSGIAGAVTGGIAGGVVGFVAPNASPVIGGIIGGLVGGATAGAVNVRLTDGPCADFRQYADAVVFGGFQGAVLGSIGGGIASSAAMVGATGAAVETAASLITMPVGLASDIAISNILNY